MPPFQSVRIFKRKGNNFTIEAEAKTFVRVIPVHIKTQLCPPLGYVSDNRNNIGTSGHEEFLMEEIPEGTKIHHIYDVELKNRFLRIFGKFLIGWYVMRFWKHAVIDKLKEILEK